MLLHYFNDDFTYVIAMYLALFMQNEIVCSLIVLILELPMFEQQGFLVRISRFNGYFNGKQCSP